MLDFARRNKPDYQVMTLEITSSCPCKCKGCYYYLEKDENSSRRESMDMINYMKIIDMAPSVLNLVLSGGEPFVHKDLLKFCEYAAKYKTKPTILTSGAVFWPKEKLKELKPFVRGVVVTVKYPDRAKDANWKGIPEDKDNAFSLLDSLKEVGIKRHVHWVADRMNERYWDDMKALAKHYKAELEILRFLSFTKELDKYQMTPEEFFRIRVYPDPLCPGGVTRFSVDLRGYVSPCIYSGHIVGNILTEPWESIQKKLHEWREAKGDAQYKCFADVVEKE